MLFYISEMLMLYNLNDKYVSYYIGVCFEDRHNLTEWPSGTS